MAGVRRRYADELHGQTDALARLVEKAKQGPVALVYGAKAPDHNNAVARKLYLEQRR